MAFFIDGILASEHLDSSGESLSVSGCDLSSIHRGEGIVNFEHKSESPLQCLGKILSAKKIFSEKDAENDRELYYWNKCKCPFIYILCELFDSEVGNHVASMFKYSADHPNTGNVLGFSIEGAKLKKEGMNIVGSIARKATLTAAPCNKSCIAEMVPGEERKSDDSIFKSEPSFIIELVQRSKQKYRENFQIEILSKAEVPGSKIPAAHAAPTPSKAVKGAPGWKHTGGGNFHHPEHGVVSVVKQGPEFHVKHKGALAGVGGKKGTFGSSKEAGGHAGDYMRSLSQGKTRAPEMQARPSPAMSKSIRTRLGFGGMMGGGLPVESTDKKNKRGLFNPDVDKVTARGGMMVGGMGRSEKKGNLKKGMSAGSGMAAPGNLVQGAALAPESMDKKMKKALWFRKAEEAYKTWEKREQFENFMAKNMPLLTKGEIQSIGQTLALRKSLRAEKNLKKMMIDEGQDSWVKKKE